MGDDELTVVDDVAVEDHDLAKEDDGLLVEDYDLAVTCDGMGTVDDD